jgi:hypothetical protein
MERVMAIENDGSAKLGSTALSGYWRQGLAELRAAAPFGDSNIAQPTNYAMPGMATPGEVTEARRDESLSPDEESALDRRLQAVESSRDDHGRDDRGIDRD